MFDLDALDSHALAALLTWQRDMGVTEAIGEAPVDRYAHAEALAARRAEAAAATAGPGAASGLDAVQPGKRRPPPPPKPVEIDPAAEAAAAVAGVTTLEALAVALEAFEHCELKRGARNFVFSDGRAGARVMVLGEAPSREEDQQNQLFIGAAGQLLDRMFAAIGLSRSAPDAEAAIYVANVLPWRLQSPHKLPAPGDIAMMRPFVEAHVRLADPDVLVVFGETAFRAACGRQGGRAARGVWTEAFGRPVLPMDPPADLLRTPAAKREAWAGLLSLKERLGRR
ncbi:uracil-DNA glycosylase [Frigidibacter sp. MR17.14]|uniref:uracil-DNA glycosylase n=1 Tax=Frigidibacter sp. MR17.14 TaxID=3126509 RepID=UPI003012C5F6